MSALATQLHELAHTRSAELDRMVSAGACVAAPDPDVWFADDPAEVLQARVACSSCPVRAACLERGLRLETTPHRGDWLPWLHGVLAGLDPEERAPIRDLRRGCHTPTTRAEAASDVAAAVERSGWFTPVPEFGGGVDDEASRRLTAQPTSVSGSPAADRAA